MEKFQREIFGYKRKNVNDFVNLVVAKTEELAKTIETQEKTIQELKEQIKVYQRQEIYLRGALDGRSQEEKRTTEEARQDAIRMIKEARENADRIIASALSRNEKIEEQTRKTERNLKKFKNRLRTVVEQQLDIIEEIEEIEMDD